MKKSILNLGKALSKSEQQQLTGGRMSLQLCSGPFYFCGVNDCYEDGARCAFRSPSGEIVRGTVKNRVCCA
ncbi:hypothetical protein [Tenacibaculum geojense]|uniref:Uncharacterized protein n=1 Tax=Tenacibaculum geojense TaxID=915352 RepID=A0ABW3JQ20_9FLAO